MESGTDGASRKGALIPVPESSDDFRNNILVPLLSAHLYDESKQCFTYKSAVLIQNPNLEEKYNALRAKKRGMGYSEEDLKEIYGFLLFEDVNKAKELGETGVLNGNSTCSTLGDPAKGVYLSMYSDCVDLHRWPHEKSGYIAIIRLTQGRVQTVSENFTPNLSAPTEGFDCHMSDQLLSVSSKNSSFRAFERTQFYIYELLDDGSGETAPSPSFACPFAIVSFSYKDSKATLLARQEQR
ncbi:protein TASOR-like [Aulostomus maculatus]